MGKEKEGTYVPCAVLPCSCEHEYQDQKYGRNRRLHNPTAKSAAGQGYRCTVCGNTKN